MLAAARSNPERRNFRHPCPYMFAFNLTPSRKPSGTETLSEQKPTLNLERVTKRFGDFTAVDGLSLSVRPGRIFGLIGPNGAGKTTTIRMIVGITAPDEGSVELFGRHIDAGDYRTASATCPRSAASTRR